MPTLKCVLWDLDGTIVDSEAFDFKSKVFQIASRRLGLSFDLEHAQFKGREARSIFHTVLARNGETVNEVWDLKYEDWYEYAVEAILDNAHLVRLRDGVADGFRELKRLGVMQGVVTSSREDVARCYLSRSESIMTGGQLGRRTASNLGRPRSRHDSRKDLCGLA
jgi:phosphoglycolate phosphatase-like HAD superfamily hydrolase